MQLRPRHGRRPSRARDGRGRRSIEPQRACKCPSVAFPESIATARLRQLLACERTFKSYRELVSGKKIRQPRGTLPDSGMIRNSGTQERIRGGLAHSSTYDYECDYKLHKNLRFTTNDANGGRRLCESGARWRLRGAGGWPGCRDDGAISPRHLFIAALPTAHAVGYHLPPLPGLRDWRGSGVNRAGNGLFGTPLRHGSVVLVLVRRASCS